MSLVLKQHSNIFLVDLKISNDKSIKIILDGDKEVNVKDCIDISRSMEGALDRDQEDLVWKWPLLEWEVLEVLDNITKIWQKTGGHI